jgi:hypothetical protein
MYTHLQRGWVQCEDFIPRAFCVPVEVDKHVNTVGIDELGCLIILQLADVFEVLNLALNPPSPLTTKAPG